MSDVYGTPAGWLSGPSVVPAPRADVEPEIKFPVDIVKIHETVRDLESKPMCSRLAYKTVINACGTYDSSSDQIFQDSDDAVRAFRNLFAIQMTACVMEDAQQDMPAACQPLLQPLSRDPRHGIKDCLASMVDTQNYWSSYLHNLENGRFLCDTMRSRIEKEEQLEHFRKVARAFQRMGNFAEEHSVSLKELKQLNEALDAALRTTLVDMEHENKQFKADMIRNFNEVARNMSSVGASVQSLFGPLDQIDQRLQNVDNIVASVSSLSTDIGTGVMGVMQLHEALDTLRAKMQLEAQQLLGDIHRKAYEVERSVHRANEVMVPLAGELELSMSKIQSINAAADGTQYKFEHIHQNLNGIAAHTNNTRESIEILDEHVQKMLPLAASASTVLSSFASGLSNVMNFGAQWVLGTAIMLIFLEVMGIGFWYALVSSALAGICKWCCLYHCCSLLIVFRSRRHPGRHATDVAFNTFQTNRDRQRCIRRRAADFACPPRCLLRLRFHCPGCRPQYGVQQVCEPLARVRPSKPQVLCDFQDIHLLSYLIHGHLPDDFTTTPR